MKAYSVYFLPKIVLRKRGDIRSNLEKIHCWGI